eukprot:GEMP01077984.1.p1 GENE.GEMP01077984.1~~GEMP01077984.1.p1  ORF type:complete len:105 (-),score=6.23 GEMP01077984.1:73-387(-)
MNFADLLAADFRALVTSCVYNFCPIDLLLSLKLPFTPAHGTELVIFIQPFHDAVEVEVVLASSPYRRAVVAGSLAVRATRVKGHLADGTTFIVNLPLPGRHGVI